LEVFTVKKLFEASAGVFALINEGNGLAIRSHLLPEPELAASLSIIAWV
jgi:hypothetical protein